jgi:hypothetical protein
VAATIAPLLDEIARLRADREARVALAARALTGSLTGLGESLDRIADDADHETIDVEALRRLADRAYDSGLVALRQEIGQGTFLREEALRHWQSFVGADQMTQFLLGGDRPDPRGDHRGLPAGRPRRWLRCGPPRRTTSFAVARLQAAEAARRTATAWADEPGMGPVMAEDADLWLPSPDFDTRLRGRLEGWIESIVEDIQQNGRSKRTLARGASVGVNVLGTGVMLATFIHTGGLTGAEVGVAAATAFLNQKLLSALFGEAAMAELIADARTRLQDASDRDVRRGARSFRSIAAGAGRLARACG